jgi:hypothetical protein
LGPLVGVVAGGSADKSAVDGDSVDGGGSIDAPSVVVAVVAQPSQTGFGIGVSSRVPPSGSGVASLVAGSAPIVDWLSRTGGDPGSTACCVDSAESGTSLSHESGLPQQQQCGTW